MDLLSIIRALWRYKIASTCVIVLTAAAAAYQLLATAPVYETIGTVVLVAPPRPPTDIEVAKNPALALVHSDNPYARSYDPGLVINVVSTFVNGDTSREALKKQGADPRFEVRQTARYGFSSPVAEVQGLGASAIKAKKTTQLVIDAFRDRLRQIQAIENVDPRYFIDVRLVEPPRPGRLQAAGKMRSLIGIMGLGVVGLFAVVSTGDALRRARDEREDPATVRLVEDFSAQAMPHNPERRPSDPERLTDARMIHRPVQYHHPAETRTSPVERPATEVAPAKATPSRATPAKATAASKATSAKATPASRATPAKAKAASKATPAKATAARATPTKATATQRTPAKATRTEPMAEARSAGARRAKATGRAPAADEDGRDLFRELDAATNPDPVTRSPRW